MIDYDDHLQKYYSEGKARIKGIEGDGNSIPDVNAYGRLRLR